jgi:hypothetical protein
VRLKAALVRLSIVTFNFSLDAPFSCNQQERHVGNNIKKEEHELVQANERVEHHIEGFSWQREPFAVQSVCPITGEHANQERKAQEHEVQDCAPHQESGESLDIHDDPPLCFCIQHEAGQAVQNGVIHCNQSPPESSVFTTAAPKPIW